MFDLAVPSHEALHIIPTPPRIPIPVGEGEREMQNRLWETKQHYFERYSRAWEYENPDTQPGWITSILEKHKDGRHLCSGNTIMADFHSMVNHWDSPDDPNIFEELKHELKVGCFAPVMGFVESVTRRYLGDDYFDTRVFKWLEWQA